MAPNAASERSAMVSVEAGTESRPALVRWSTWVPRGQGGQCYDAFAVMADEGPILIDPIYPGEAAFERLRGLIGRRPVATIVTSGWHERDAYRVRERWGAPVWAPAAGTAELEGKPDHLYRDGDALPGAMRPLTVDAQFAGDSVLTWAAPTEETYLFTGDAIMAELNSHDPRPDHWRRETGLYLFLHGPGDRGRFRRSLDRVLDEEFDVICSAHSVVVREGSASAAGKSPKEALAQLLETGRVIERPMGYGVAVGLASA